MKFRAITSPGRSGSHFLCWAILTATHAIAAHSDFEGGITGKTEEEYKQSLISRAHIDAEEWHLSPAFETARVCVECNPASLETITAEQGCTILEAVEEYLDDAKYLYLPRHPKGYVESLIGHSMQWLIHKEKGFEKAYDTKNIDPEAIDPLGFACLMWSARNRIHFPLLEQDYCIMVRYEDLFKSPKDLANNLLKIFNFFDLDLKHEYGSADALGLLFGNVVGRKNRKNFMLDNQQLKTVENLCAEEMRILGYEKIVPMVS